MIKKVLSKEKNGIRNLLFLVLVLIILIAPFTTAHFVCGKVNDSNEMSASWYNVRIFYPDENSYGTCEISPAENKFCCDVEDIKGVSWHIGDKVFAEIFDPETGYFAGPVSVVTTGEGYDVFRGMQLKKAIEIYNPNKKLLFSNTSEFFLNASFAEPYTFVKIQRPSGQEVLCDNCTNFSSVISANYGFNNLSILSKFRKNIFLKDIGFWLLKNFNFKRDFICEKCIENFIKTNKEVEVNIKINLSSEVENLELREYVPIKFKILDTDDKIERYSPTHNVLLWNVSGQNIIKTYKLKSPFILFFPRKYVFKTELGGQVLNEDLVYVYRWIKFFSFTNALKNNSVEENKNFKIGPSNPLIIEPGQKNIKRIVIFPKRNFNFIKLNLKKIEKLEGIPNLISYYEFDSNLKRKDIGKVYLEVKIQKLKYWIHRYKGIQAYIYNYNDEEWQSVKMEKYSEDKKYFYYKAYLNSSDKIAVAGIK